MSTEPTIEARVEALQRGMLTLFYLLGNDFLNKAFEPNSPVNAMVHHLAGMDYCNRIDQIIAELLAVTPPGAPETDLMRRAMEQVRKQIQAKSNEFARKIEVERSAVFKP